MKLAAGMKAEILKSLDLVGLTKAVGYLPIATIERVIIEDIDRFKEKYENAGLAVKIFDAEKTPIKSGAFFVFDMAAFAQEIERFKDLIARKGWKSDPVYIVDQIAMNWFDEDDPVLTFISALYGDQRDASKGQGE